MGRAWLMGVSPVRHPVGPRKRRLTFSQAELLTHQGPPTLDHETAGQLSAVWGHMSPGGTHGPSSDPGCPTCSAGALELGEGYGGSPGTRVLLPLCQRPHVPGRTRTPSSASDHSSALSTLLPGGVGRGEQPAAGREGPSGTKDPGWTLQVPEWALGKVGLVGAHDLLPTGCICFSPKCWDWRSLTAGAAEPEPLLAPIPSCPAQSGWEVLPSLPHKRTPFGEALR